MCCEVLLKFNIDCTGKSDPLKILYGQKTKHLIGL